MSTTQTAMTKTTTSIPKKSPKKSQQQSVTTLPKIDPLIQLPNQLTEQFRELRLPSLRDHFRSSANRVQSESSRHLEFFSELTTLECEARREGRVKRLMTQSKLPLGKSWESFRFDRLPIQVTRQLETLRDGSFLDRRENVLIFGKPGSGKSHALCALAEQPVQRGRSMMFTLHN